MFKCYQVGDSTVVFSLSLFVVQLSQSDIKHNVFW